MITILGIDCSSSTIGWALLGVDNGYIKLIEHGYIKPPGKDGYSIVERLDIVSYEIKYLCERLSPNYTIVEEIIQYMKNQTSANTIITLAVFNRAVALQLYRSTGKIPLFLLPVSVRSRLKKFLQLDRKIEKEDIPNILQDYFGKTFFKLVGYKKRGKNKGQPIIEVYDESDACAVAWAGLIELGLIKEIDEKLL